MQVKTNDNKISFRFEDSDGFLDVGYQILSQENIEQLLPYKRKRLGKREQLIYNTTGDNIIQLKELISNMDKREIVDVIYELLYMIVRIEENGFLKRQCLWYKWDNIYYDTIHEYIKIAILPITCGFDEEQCREWNEDLRTVIDNITQYLSDKNSERIQNIFDMIEDDGIKLQDALKEIDKLGCSVSTVLLDNLDTQKQASLKLIYIGNKREVVIDVDKDEFVIGRDEVKADGVIPQDLSSLISRLHCCITKVNNKYFVQDLKSTNYTLINGVMIPPYELMELENNDVLSMADLEFRAKINYIGG